MDREQGRTKMSEADLRVHRNELGELCGTRDGWHAHEHAFDDKGELPWPPHPCATCLHDVRSHAIDDEERRECMQCACRQYVNRAEKESR